ncbi:SAG-related sequence SRS59K, partial [Toxoplasma gondii ARI]
MKRQRSLKQISVFFVFCLGLASATSSSAASVNDSGGSELGDLAGALRGRQSGREAVQVPENNVCSSWAGVSIKLTQDQTEALFQCGPKTVLAPLQNPEKVYLEEDCRSATLLEKAVPGAKWAAIAEPKGAYKLTLPPHRKKAETLYYRCKSEALIVAEISLIWFIKQYHEASEEARKKILETLSRYYDLVRVITLVIAGIIERKQPVYIKLGTGKREAVFKCGGSLTTLEPTQNTDKPKFCKSTDCKETTDLSTAFPGAYWDDRNKDAHIYRLVIPTVNRKDTRMYYKCKGASDSADPCTVLISVKSTETDDHDEEEDVQECTVGTDKKVTLSPTDTVKFKCNLGTVVQPSFSSGSPEVFDDSDGSCSARASLTSLVDASLTEDSSHDKY